MIAVRWPKLPTEAKREIAESIVEKIVFGDGEIDITLSCLPSSEELTKSRQQEERAGMRGGGPLLMQHHVGGAFRGTTRAWANG